MIKSKILILAIILTLTVMSGAHSIIAQGNLELRVLEPQPASDLPLFAENQLIVKFRSRQSETAITALKVQHNASEIRRSAMGGFVTLSFPDGIDVRVKADIFNKNPLVEYAHPNYSRQHNFVPNDEFYSFQWHFDDDNTNNPGGASTNPDGGANGGGIVMEQAWNISTGNSSVVVAVLDSGVAYEDFSDPNPAGCYNMGGALKACKIRGQTISEYFQASDLANTTFLILNGSDLVNGDNHPNDDRNHGTHVTGTIAQSTNNTEGVAGIAFNTTIMPIKILDASGSGFDNVIADGIYLAVANGVDVINMSFGGPGDGQALRDAVEFAFDAGVVLVASAGNEFLSGNPVNYPAAYDAHVIAVGATRYDETRSPYSSTGAYVDVAAPGGDNSVDQNEDGFADGVLQQTFSTNNPSDFAYWFFQGTSMAAPHVSALAALILSVDSSLTPMQVREVIESTAEDKGISGRDDEYGHGIIDARAALLSLIPTVSIILTSDGTVAFGVLPLESTATNTAGDIQTISVTTGPVDLDIKSTDFFDNENTWSLNTTNGANQVKWEFSTTGSTWTTFSSSSTLFTLANDVAEGATEDLYLQITMPSESATGNEYSSTVTIVATTP